MYDLAPENLDFASLSIAEKKQPATFKSSYDVQTTFLEISIAKGSKAFKYDVNIESTTGSLTKGPPDDGHGAMRRNVCFDLLYAAVKKTNGFGTGLGYDLPLVYNRQNVVYFAKPLPHDVIKVELCDDEDYKDVSKEILYMMNPCDSVHVSVTRVYGEDCEIDLHDSISNAAPIDAESISSRDRSFRTFLELLTSAKPVFERSHVPTGVSFFQKDYDEDMGQGKCKRRGLTKGVCVVEKEDGKPYPALVVDCKTAAFFKQQPMLESIKEFNRGHIPSRCSDPVWNAIARLYKDVRVHVSASSGPKMRKSFQILRFTDKSADDLRVSNRENVTQYFRRMNVKLKHPELRCVEVDSKPCRFYPVELLMVADNQRVPLEKADAAHSQALLKANSVKPAERVNLIKEQLIRMFLWGNSENHFLSAFGVSVSSEFVKVKAGIRVPPSIEVASGESIRVNPERAKWNLNNKRYVSTAPLLNWAVLCNFERARGAEGMIKNFIVSFMKAAQKRGLKIADPRIYPFNGDLEAAFYDLKADGREYVLYFSPLAEKKHDLLKLYERQFCLLTQHVSLERVEDVVMRKSVTILDNIVHKTNMKLGGLNVIPRIEPLGERMEMDSGELLVIAYDVCHPAPMNAAERRVYRSIKEISPMTSFDPSVVGIVANCVEHPHAFIGDFHFQVARKEALNEDILNIRLKWIFHMLEEHRPHKPRPKHIVILRDGVSEGQYAMTINVELEAIREAIRQIDPAYQPTFTLIIATKRHHKRFVDANGRFPVNTKPGTVVDTTVVRGDVTEFFLQSHLPLLGTAKIPQYAVLCDEAKFSMDELQAFLHCLCHSHQIIDSAVSIPEPIYAADEIAKRGKNIFQEQRKTNKLKIPRLPSGLIDCEQLTDDLAYWHTELQGVRFNA